MNYAININSNKDKENYWKGLRFNNDALLLKRIRTKLKNKRDKSVDIMKNLSIGLHLKDKNNNKITTMNGLGNCAEKENEKSYEKSGNKELTSSLLNINTNEISFTYSDDTDTKRGINLSLEKQNQQNNIMNKNNNNNNENNIEDFKTFYVNLHKKLFGT